jgi:hypothetical protein
MLAAVDVPLWFSGGEMAEEQGRPPVQGPQHVVVTDVRMPFWSMVVFMVKWAIASIPAFVILVALSAALWLGVAGLLMSVAAGRQAAPPVAPTGATDARPAARQQADYIEKVTVSRVTVRKTPIGPLVSGEIKNTGERSLTKVELTAYLLDEAGKAIFETSSDAVLVNQFLPDNAPLKAGYSKHFDIIVKDPPSDWAGKVDVKVTGVEAEP